MEGKHPFGLFSPLQCFIFFLVYLLKNAELTNKLIHFMENYMQRRTKKQTHLLW